jgi:hypothetical protein
MIAYLLASGAVWTAVSAIAGFSHFTLMAKIHKNLDGGLDEQTGKRRLPLYFIGHLAFALIFAYVLRLVWPAEVPLTGGLLFGALAGMLIYIPAGLAQFAMFHYPAIMVLGGALIGIFQTTVAGLIGGLIL